MTTRTREQLYQVDLGHVTVVAAANYYDEHLFDWAAYIGPTAWGVDRIAERGCKLVQDQAEGFFATTYLPIEKYRK